MGLFSNLFKRKVSKVIETQLGLFTLLHTGKDKSTWSNNDTVYAVAVRGTEDGPYPDQLKFLENIKREIQQLREQITKKFWEEFREADIEIDFTNWEERFKMVALDVIAITAAGACWSITFEDLKQPYAHFNLFIEGQQLTGFSIDT